jgi:hypothetical protein
MQCGVGLCDLAPDPSLRDRSPALEGELNRSGPAIAAEAEWIERFLGLMGNRDEFLQTWAMGLERNGSQRQWNTSGPRITGDRRAIQTLSIPQGRRLDRTAQRLYSLTLPEGQVVSVQVD